MLNNFSHGKPSSAFLERCMFRAGCWPPVVVDSDQVAAEGTSGR